MNRRLAATIIIASILLITCQPLSAATADDYWPTWRGPRFTGQAVKGSPPIRWSETQNIKWKVEFPGQGSSSPVIWADRIFFLTAEPVVAASAPQPAVLARRSGGGGRRGGGGLSRGPSGPYKFSVVCLDRASGRTLWQRIVRQELPHEGHHPTGSFASYSPVTDGKLVWAAFGSRGIHCFDVEGNPKWSKPLPQMNIRAGFGEGSSVALAGDAVIAVTDHEGQSSIQVFNKLTGDLLWKKQREERTSWATPAAAEVDGKTQIITSATNLIRSYDLKTGDLIWQCAGQTENVIPSPVVGFGMVFCVSGYRGNSAMAIKLGRTGDLTGTDAVVWKVSKATPYVPSPLLCDDQIYFYSSNRAVLSCYKARTGEPVFVEQPLGDMRDVYASPVAADGRIYLPGRDGTCQVIKYSDKFEPLATNRLDDGFDASPAVVGDELYLKGNQNFYCIAKQ